VALFGKMVKHKIKMKTHTLFIFILCSLFVTSCASYKKVPYLQDEHVMKDLQEARPMHDVKIMPKDLLTITVNTADPEVEVADFFNLTVQSYYNTSRSNSLSQQPTLQQYLVSNEGTIDFPVLGCLHVSGLTKGEAEELIREKLSVYLQNPIVTVRMSSYKVSVLGEVAHPGIFTVNYEKINVFEALSLAGDLTIWGMRDNVKLIRENADGQSEVIKLNLNNSDIVDSPYYYLQQNDVLYVTPNKSKAKNSGIGQSTPLWFSAAGTMVSIANIIVTFILLKE
jgi:polysaccharide export outer membrane protein